MYKHYTCVHIFVRVLLQMHIYKIPIHMIIQLYIHIQHTHLYISVCACVCVRVRV